MSHATAITLVQVWVASSYVIMVGLVVDQLRRPLPEWEGAGRERRFWVALTLITGFHGLGQYTAVAYFALVLPRFRDNPPVESRQVLRRAAKLGRAERRLAPTEELVLIAGVLVFAASVIHSVLITDHFEHYWLSGVVFGVIALAQATWTALVYKEPLNRRLLVVGAVGNALVIVLWAFSRTAGVPVGPQAGTPEPVGVADVFATLDELSAIALIAVVLARLRGTRLSISPLHIRLATMIAGPLFIYSLLSTFGGHPHA